MFGKLLRILKLWTEWFSIPLGLLLWIVSPAIIRWFDPVAATFDTGILQVIVFALIAILFFNGAAFLGIKFNFPEVFNFYENANKETFNELTTWQKYVYLLCLYLGLLLALVLLAATL